MVCVCKEARLGLVSFLFSFIKDGVCEVSNGDLWEGFHEFVDFVGRDFDPNFPCDPNHVNGSLGRAPTTKHVAIFI